MALAFLGFERGQNQHRGQTLTFRRGRAAEAIVQSEFALMQTRDGGNEAKT
jgi:hypothetical protein